MKRLLQIVCLILIMSMILALPAFAAEQASHFFMSHSCYLWEISDSEFQVCFDVTAVGQMDVLGVSEIKVQQSSDGSNWTTVATYYDYYDTDTSFHSDEISFSDVSSGYYRAKVTFHAEKDNGTGEYTAYTSSLHY